MMNIPIKEIPVERRPVMIGENINIPVFPGMTLGMQVFISINGIGSFKSILVGMEYGKYFILKMPVMPALPFKVYQQNYFVIRYFQCGSVYGFRTSLIGLIKEPVRLFILDYPLKIESLDLRKTERYACQLPASVCVSTNGDPVERKGIITDISSNGCCFECDLTDGQKSSVPEIGTIVDLSLNLGSEDKMCMLNAEIRTQNLDSKRIMYGLKYNPDFGIESHQAAIEAIRIFIEKLKINT
jgi:hypothetical protein